MSSSPIVIWPAIAAKIGPLMLQAGTSLSVDANCLEDQHDPTLIQAIMHFNAMVFDLRSVAQRGTAFNDVQDMIRHGLALLCAPVVWGAIEVRSKAQRHEGRIQPRVRRPGFHLYRSDGAARGQSRASRFNAGSAGHNMCLWGSAYCGYSGQDAIAVSTAFG